MVAIGNKESPTRKAYNETADALEVVDKGLSYGADYWVITRVSGGAADGEISTIVYKTGGASGTVIATRTFSYDGNGDIETETLT